MASKSHPLHRGCVQSRPTGAHAARVAGRCDEECGGERGMDVVSLHFSEALVRRAVGAFWWRVTGWSYVGAFVFVLACFISLVWMGDRSWWVGLSGAAVGLAVLFAVAVYVVHYRSSMARYRRMRAPEATIEARGRPVSPGVGRRHVRVGVVGADRGLGVPRLPARLLLEVAVHDAPDSGPRSSGMRLHHSQGESERREGLLSHQDGGARASSSASHFSRASRETSPSAKWLVGYHSTAFLPLMAKA